MARTLLFLARREVKGSQSVKFLMLMAADRVVQAASAGTFAAPTPQAIPSAGGGLLRVTVALLVVLALVLAAAWFGRRVRGLGGAHGRSLQILAQLPLGQRERAVLIRVEGQRLLLGVTHGSVTTLHVLDGAGVDSAEGESGGDPPGAPGPTRPTFKSLLLKSLGK